MKNFKIKCSNDAETLASIQELDNDKLSGRTKLIKKSHYAIGIAPAAGLGAALSVRSGCRHCYVSNGNFYVGRAFKLIRARPDASPNAYKRDFKFRNNTFKLKFIFNIH